MRALVGVAVVAAVGCSVEPIETETSTQPLGVLPAATPIDRCQKTPDLCNLYNGGGVYVEELGRAGIGPSDLMITTFVNSPDYGGVSWLGMYKVAKDRPQWQSSAIDHAIYTQNGVARDYRVLHLQERDMRADFTLIDDTTSEPIEVEDLEHLALVVNISEKPYTLSFGEGATASTNDSDVVPLVPVWGYRMYWNAGRSVAANPEIYCERALQGTEIEREPDDVVFEQGIAVGVLNAKTSFGLPDYVTLSCRRGSIATVRSWGYTYSVDGTTGDHVMFEGAMHMKRASYCGDETFFTRRHTPIYVQDGDNIQTGYKQGLITVANLEALWGTTSTGIRALCVNPDGERRKGVVFPPGGSEQFDGQCLDQNGALAFRIPTCRGNAFAHIYLEDSAAPKNQ